MIIETNFKITKNWIEAFNEHDIEKLLSLYHEDADHYSPKLKVLQPETKGVIKGKEAMRKWWGDSFKRFPELNYELVSLTVNNEYVMMIYKRRVKTEEETEVKEMLHIIDGAIISSAVVENN